MSNSTETYCVTLPNSVIAIRTVEFIIIAQPNNNFQDYYAYVADKSVDITQAACVVPCLYARNILNITTSDGQLHAANISNLVDTCTTSFSNAELIK